MRASTLDRWLAATREALFFALLMAASLICDDLNRMGAARPVPTFDLAHARQLHGIATVVWIAGGDR